MKQPPTIQGPIIIKPGSGSTQKLAQLKKRNPIVKIIDIFTEQLAELFEIEHANLRSNPGYARALQQFVKSKTKQKLSGIWIYFPHNETLLHTLSEKDLFTLRTNRNKNLITEQEQQTLANFTVGIAGLSIGSHIAVNLAYAGMSSTLKIADFDILSTSNLNRVKARLNDIGTTKLDITSRQLYDINPYTKIIAFPQGITNKNLKDFVRGNPKPKLIFDAIDDFEIKIRLRLEARSAGIPVVMMTNLADSVLVDVERYDHDRELPLFNGIIGNTPEEILSKPVSEADKNRYAVQIVGRENVPPRAISSLQEINKTLVGRPQLLSTVVIGSGIASFIAREIALGNTVNSGRRLIKFEETFKP